jgi:hypothetical protein
MPTDDKYKTFFIKKGREKLKRESKLPENYFKRIIPACIPSVFKPAGGFFI